MSKWAARLLHLTFTVLVATVLAEGMLRLIGVSGETDRLDVYEFDPEIGWRTRPSFRHYRSTPWYAHFNFYDPDGFPADEAHWKQQLAREAPSIAFLGDSMTEGYYVPYDQTMTARVGRELPELQVLNLGVSGYAPDQYLLAARRHLPGFNVVRIAVIFFPANDTVDVLSTRYLNYAKPMFGESLARPVNVPLDRVDPGGDSSPLALVRASAIYTMFRPFYKRYVSPPPEYQPESERLRYSEEGMTKSVSLMAQISQDNPGIPFRIFYIPRREEIHHPELLQRNTALFRSQCDIRGVSCVVPDFLAANGDTDRFYIIGDEHLNAIGTEQLARVVLGAYGER